MKERRSYVHVVGTKEKGEYRTTPKEDNTVLLLTGKKIINNAKFYLFGESISRKKCYPKLWGFSFVLGIV